MGMIHIEAVEISPYRKKSSSPMDYGRTRAVADAIKWLVVLPDAIKQDHVLHEDGAKPEKGFGKDADA